MTDYGLRADIDKGAIKGGTKSGALKSKASDARREESLSATAMEVVDLAQCRSEKNRTGYFGVNATRSGKQFEAKFRYDGKLRCLGTFNTAEEAARAVAIKRAAVSKAADARREEKKEPEHEQNKALVAVCDKKLERE